MQNTIKYTRAWQLSWLHSSNSFLKQHCSEHIVVIIVVNVVLIQVNKQKPVMNHNGHCLMFLNFYHEDRCVPLVLPDTYVPEAIAT